MCTIFVSYGVNAKQKRVKESNPEKLKKTKISFPQQHVYRDHTEMSVVKFELLYAKYYRG